MRFRSLILGSGVAVLAIAAPIVAGAAKTVAHPDKLKYPELEFMPPAARDYRVALKNGMVAYLVPDKALPLVSIEVIMRIGPDLDPAGKEGTARGVAHLITRGGTKSKTAQQIEDRAAYLGASLSSQMGGGGGGFFGSGGAPLGDTESSASINLLSKDFDEGLAILIDCLKSPAFEQERFALARDQIMQEMKQRNDDSQTIEDYQWDYLMQGENHWTNRRPTEKSVKSITREDLAAFHKRYVGPENFLVTVSGDFDRASVTAKLEQAFAGWGSTAERPGPPAAPAQAPAPSWYMVEKDVNQGRVTMGLVAPDRYDPDYQAFRVMNVILGGGGFSSRLVNRIRSDEGLAYSVNSGFIGGTYYDSIWRIRFQSKVRSVPRAMQLALEEMKTITAEKVTQKELDLARNLLIQSLPAAFETAQGIAGVLAMEEVTGRYARNPDYFQTLRASVNAVTIDDVNRVAKRLLDPSKLVVLAVGDTEEMMKNDPKFETNIKGLAGGEPKYLPLRDPMTMQPIATP
jgi:predicted Zn-dependent peptidase